MPPRSTAIVTCSCGWVTGRNIDSFLEDILEDNARERMVRVQLESDVPRMVRHWQLGHTVTLRDPRFEATITRAAQKLAEQREA